MAVRCTWLVTYKLNIHPAYPQEESQPTENVGRRGLTCETGGSGLSVLSDALFYFFDASVLGNADAIRFGNSYCRSIRESKGPTQLIEQTCSERSESIKLMRAVPICLIRFICCE